jgi:hypothetical protein
LEQLRADAVVGVEEVNRADARPRLQRDADAAVARRAEAAVPLANVQDAVRVGAGVLAADEVRLRRRAAVVDQDDAVVVFGLLAQRGLDGVDEQRGVAVDGDDDGENGVVVARHEPTPLDGFRSLESRVCGAKTPGVRRL